MTFGKHTIGAISAWTMVYRSCVKGTVEDLIENLPMDRAKPVTLALQEFQHALDAALTDLAGHIETAVERE